MARTIKIELEIEIVDALAKINGEDWIMNKFYKSIKEIMDTYVTDNMKYMNEDLRPVKYKLTKEWINNSSEESVKDGENN